ncbi:MAG: DUF3846 domain-containing protein [Clostridiales bacterium]|nr:DUF3846 domain-containing protein [Clostridiales bacterium]
MINPYEEKFEEVVIGKISAIFTSLRLDRDKLPQRVFAYDIRHADDDGMEAAEIAKYVMVNHMGTIITKEPLELDEHGSMILDDYDFCYVLDSTSITLDQFMSDEKELPKTIDVVIVQPFCQPAKQNIKNDLTTLQQQVGGYIQMINPFDDNACLICDEEGKIKGLPLNRQVGNDIIAGTFIIAGIGDDGELSSLSDKQIEKYKNKFNDLDLSEFDNESENHNKTTIER